MQTILKILTALFLFLAAIAPATAKADFPRFRIEKAGDSDKYLLMTTRGLIVRFEVEGLDAPVMAIAGFEK